MDRASICIWIGLLLAIVGTLSSFSWNAIYDFIARTELPVSPRSKTYPLWKKSEITMNIYLFNWTNPEKLMEKDYKPEVVELGPYSFKETYEKVNVTWNTNHTVTYRRLRHWYFDPANSKGSLDDNVTMLNVVPLSGSFLARNWSFLMTYALSAAIRIMGKSVWIHRSAREVLFDGYDDPLLRIVYTAPSLFGTTVPSRKVAWFISKNGSLEADGVLNVETASEDITKKGIVRRWNHLADSRPFGGSCGKITGSIGDLFPPGQTRDKIVEMFAPDLCRSFELQYMEDTEVLGITGYRYEASKTMIDNGTMYPDTSCNCGGECLPAGVFNLSSCRYGMPAFMSYPHFFDADPYYLRHINGLKPDPKKHRFHITVEPNTGIPLNLQARLQLNLRLQPSSNIGMFMDVPTILFPVMWFEELATIPSSDAFLLKILLLLPVVGPYVSFTLMLIGLVILAFNILPRILRIYPWNVSHRLKGKSSEMTALQVALSKRCLRGSTPEKEEFPMSPEGRSLLNSKQVDIKIK